MWGLRALGFWESAEMRLPSECAPEVRRLNMLRQNASCVVRISIKQGVGGRDRTAWHIEIFRTGQRAGENMTSRKRKTLNPESKAFPDSTAASNVGGIGLAFIGRSCETLVLGVPGFLVWASSYYSK